MRSSTHSCVLELYCAAARTAACWNCIAQHYAQLRAEILMRSSTHSCALELYCAAARTAARWNFIAQANVAHQLASLP